MTKKEPRESELYEMGRNDAAAGLPKRTDEIGLTSYYVKGYEGTPYVYPLRKKIEAK